MKIKIAVVSILVFFFAIHCPPGQVKKHFTPGHMKHKKGKHH
ncbi:MAG: hypothetical protein OEZ34_10560 [Spirochaetia bacterium]|nr:hypothetical protein [Spirochaetia bacterium]